MFKPISARKAVSAALAAGLLAGLAACSTKSVDAGSSANTGGVKTDVGIKDKTLTLGVLTDQTGVFAALGAEITNAQQLFWGQVNAKGGVCGQFQVKLEVKDHNYNVQNAVSLYTGMKNDVLAFQQILGSPQNAALAPQLKRDGAMAIPRSGAPFLTENPNTLVVGATYTVEMINVLDQLLETGKLSKGDTVGVIYFEGDLGESGLAGVKAVAKTNDLKVVEYKIKPTDSDLTAQVTDLKSRGGKAIALAAAPPQAAAVAAAASSQGLDVPIAANGPAYAPSLLTTPAKEFVKRNFYIGYPVAPFETQRSGQVRSDYLAKYPGTNPTLQITIGYGEAMVMKEILEAACKNGDLTRKGVLAAKSKLNSVQTEGLLPALDYTRTGVSATPQSFVLRAADGPGGVELVKGPYQGPDVPRG